MSFTDWIKKCLNSENKILNKQKRKNPSKLTECYVILKVDY